MSSKGKKSKDKSDELRNSNGLSQLEVAKKFNKTLKDLAKKAWLLNKKSIKMDSIRNLLSTAIDEDPMLVIKLAGPIIYEFKAEIENRQEYIENLFDKIDFKGKYGQSNTMQANMEIFDAIKNKWGSLGDEEKIEVGDAVFTLLDCYINHLLFEKIKSGRIKPTDVGFRTTDDSEDNSE